MDKTKSWHTMFASRTRKLLYGYQFLWLVESPCAFSVRSFLSLFDLIIFFQVNLSQIRKFQFNEYFWLVEKLGGGCDHQSVAFQHLQTPGRWFLSECFVSGVAEKCWLTREARKGSLQAVSLTCGLVCWRTLPRLWLFWVFFTWRIAHSSSKMCIAPTVLLQNWRIENTKGTFRLQKVSSHVS